MWEYFKSETLGEVPKWKSYLLLFIGENNWIWLNWRRIKMKFDNSLESIEFDD